MLKHLSREDGFSMVEAAVAGVVFITASVGVFATITSMKNISTTSNGKVAAAYYGKQVLAQLRGQVDATSWDQNGNLLKVGGGGTATYGPLVNGAYTIAYTVTNTASGGRRVDMTVCWNQGTCP